MLKTANSQRGVALLTILLLVVSITVVAGAMLASQKIVIRRSGLLFNQNQLLQDINAGQQLAATVIRADNKLNDTDSAQDIWAKPLPPYTLGTHTITAEIRDESSRFNINNLYNNGAIDEAALAFFQRLLKQLNLDPEIAVAVLDWQDTDSEVYNDGGNESTVYASQDNSSDSPLPNQPFTTVEQLIEVRGVDLEVLATLQPFVTAIPFYLPINMNTASPTVLGALIEGGSAEQMRSLVELREQNVLETVDDLWQLPAFSVVSAEQRTALTPLLAIDSQAFMALITATDGTTDGAAKQRFATVLISSTRIGNEGAASNTANSNSNNANDNANNSPNTNNVADNNQSDKEVKVIAQRLWAFRPRF